MRVTRRGGRIIMGNWIPIDPTIVAQILKISAAYTGAPPAGRNLRRCASLQPGQSVQTTFNLSIEIRGQSDYERVEGSELVDLIEKIEREQSDSWIIHRKSDGPYIELKTGVRDSWLLGGGLREVILANQRFEEQIASISNRPDRS